MSFPPSRAMEGYVNCLAAQPASALPAAAIANAAPAASQLVAAVPATPAPAFGAPAGIVVNTSLVGMPALSAVAGASGTTMPLGGGMSAFGGGPAAAAGGGMGMIPMPDLHAPNLSMNMPALGAGAAGALGAGTMMGAGGSPAMQALEMSINNANGGGATPAPNGLVAPTGPATNSRSGYTAQSVHMRQVKDDKYLPDGPSTSGNCAITSAVMALRMAGYDIPGFSGEKVQAVLDKARIMAKGVNDLNNGSNLGDLKTMFGKIDGVKYKTSLGRGSDKDAITWAKAGMPVIVSGNPNASWNRRIGQTFDGRHSVLLTWDGQNLKINDPLSRGGAITITPAELAKYMNTTVPRQSGGGREAWYGDALAIIPKR